MSRTAKGYIYIVLTAIIFSTMEVVLKTVTGVFAPMQITALRFFIGGIVLVPFALKSLKQHNAKITKKDIPFFLLSGFCLVAFAMSLYQMAVTYTKASVVAIIFSSNPIFVTIMAYLILKEDIHKNHIIALIFEVVAIIVIIDPFNSDITPVGALLAFAAAFAFSIYVVIGRKNTHKYGSIAMSSFSDIAGSTELLLILALGNIPAIGDIFEKIGLTIYNRTPIFPIMPSYAILPFLYICIVVSAGGFVCQMLAVEATSAREASLVFFIKPILAPILAMIVINEEIEKNMWIGIVLMLVGSGISIIPDIIKIKKRKA